jgi:hypothetical protein
MKLTRWQILKEASPSEKTLYKCLICERISPTPDEKCPTMDCEGIERRLNATLPKAHCPTCESNEKIGKSNRERLNWYLSR